MTNLDRKTTTADRLALKAATDRCLTRAGGGSNFKHVTRVEGTQLHRYVNPDMGDFVPVDVLLDMDMAAKAPIITRMLAEIQGFMVVPMASRNGPKDMAGMISTVIRECSDVSAMVLDAYSDSEISSDEANSIYREIDEAVEALQTLRATVQASAT